MSEYCKNCEALARELEDVKTLLASATDALRIHADMNGELSGRYQNAMAWNDETTTILREMVEHCAKHSGACGVDVDGELVVTPESCMCSELHQRARKAAGMWPWGTGAMQAREVTR